MADLVIVFEPEERTECLRRGEEMAARVGGPVSGGSEDAAGGSGRLPGGAGLPGASSASVAIDEHAGEPDEAAEEAFAGGGGVPEPVVVRPAAGGPVSRSARAWAVEERAYFNTANVTWSAAPAAGERAAQPRLRSPLSGLPPTRATPLGSRRTAIYRKEVALLGTPIRPPRLTPLNR